MIYTSPTVGLVNHCFTSSTTRTNRTGLAKRNTALYGSYKFVYIGQLSGLSKQYQTFQIPSVSVEISGKWFDIIHRVEVGRSLLYLIAQVSKQCLLWCYTE